MAGATIRSPTPGRLFRAPTRRREGSLIRLYGPGTEMLIWGGMDITTVTRLNTGARYSPTSNSWASITTVNAPPGRDSHTAVWTGSEMIIWGGFGNSFPWELGDGRRYNPLSDAWTNVSTVGSPIPRHYHTAVWTGTDMIVWGGSTNDPPRLNTGGRYNPADNLWTATPTIGAPPGTMLHTAVWTGKQMIVWGGFGGTGDAVAATGGSYDPLANSWALTTLAQAPLPRELHTTVWTGSEMLVFGGFANVGAVNSVHSYTPSRIVYLYQKP